MDDEVQSHFLRIRLAKLSVFQMIGILERWIRWRIENSTENQLLSAESELMDKMREKQEGKASLAIVYKEWISHPLQNLLLKERVRREILLEESSKDYLGQMSNGLSATDIRDYLIWKGDKHGTVNDWIKDKRRSLPVVMNEETETSDRGLLLLGETVNSPEPYGSSGLKGPLETSFEGETKAYVPGRKRQER
jgi:hypothetical protein